MSNQQVNIIDPIQQLTEKLAADHALDGGAVTYAYLGGENYKGTGVNCYDRSIDFAFSIHRIAKGYINYSTRGQMSGRVFGALKIS